MCFAPAELGLIFAAASSDGNLSVHSSDLSLTGEWSVALVQNEGGLPAHPLGATCVSFCPALEAGALTSARTSKVRPPLCELPGPCSSASACVVCKVLLA